MTQNTDVSQGCHTASSMLSCLTHGLILSALLSIIARDPAPDYVVRRARLLRRAHVNRAALADPLVTSSLVAALDIVRPEALVGLLLLADHALLLLALLLLLLLRGRGHAGGGRPPPASP